MREEALRFLMRQIGDEDMAEKPVVLMPSKASSDPKSVAGPLFLIPGIEGKSGQLPGRKHQTTSYL